MAETKRHVERLKSLSHLDPSHDLGEGDVNNMGEGVDAVSPSQTTVPMNSNDSMSNMSTNYRQTNQPQMSTNASANWRQLSLNPSDSNHMTSYQKYHSPQAAPASPQAMAMQSFALSHHKSLAAGTYHIFINLSINC